MKKKIKQLLAINNADGDGKYLSTEASKLSAQCEKIDVTALMSSCARQDALEKEK